MSKTKNPKIHECKIVKKRRDGNFDYVLVRSVYDPAIKNSRNIGTKKLGTLLAGYTDIEKDLIPVGTPEAKALTAALRRKTRLADPTKTLPPLEDQRQASKVKYSLPCVALVIVLAMMSGKTTARQIANFWAIHRTELAEKIPGFPEDNISHDTVRRIMQMIGKVENPCFLQQICQSKLKDFEKHVIAVDGQSVRAARLKDERVPLIFNAFDTTSGLAVSQLLIDVKTNEKTQAASLLESLNLTGAIVTADAMNTVKTFAGHLLERNADYCLAVKSNTKLLYKNIKLLFDLEPTELQRRGHKEISRWKSVRHETLELGHGRIEERSYRILPADLLDKEIADPWAGLEEGLLVETAVKMTNKKNGEISEEKRYFISSLSPEGKEIEETVANAIRGHWKIENSLHWVLDVTFMQDRTQCRNADFLKGKTLFTKAAYNYLTLLRNAESPDEEARSTYASWQTYAQNPILMIDNLLDISKNHA